MTFVINLRKAGQEGPDVEDQSHDSVPARSQATLRYDISVMSFIHDNFLLETEEAQNLFHRYAAAEPILDYHSHLPPKDIAQNRQFANLFEIWLEGDHYKWRAMRANGVA